MLQVSLIKDIQMPILDINDVAEINEHNIEQP